MSKFLVLFLLLWIPLQISYAAAGTYDSHDAATEHASHFGHHQHQHQNGNDHSCGKDSSCGKDAPTPGKLQTDCEQCHHFFPILLVYVSSISLPLDSVAMLQKDPPVPFIAPDTVFRPPLSSHA